MGTIRSKLNAADEGLEVLRNRAMQLRQIHRALERVGLEKLAEEIEGVADDIVEECKSIDSAVSVVVAELVAGPAPAAALPEEEAVSVTS